MRAITAWLLGMVLTLGSAPLYAAAWGLPQLMASLAEVQHSRARFTEEKQLAMLTAPLRMSGTLAYVRPDRLEKIVTQPHPETLRVVGDRLELQSARGHRSLSLQSQPQLFALVESLRATLAGDLPALERHYRVALAGDATDWQLTLTPRYAALAQTLDEIRIAGSAQAVREVRIVEADGDQSLMRIQALDD